MQFNHPEILALLFLLIIPILVHLFQLQRFKKEEFTNVKFLREIELESRKSSRIKKLLILATRLLALASIIMAFAQPVLRNDQGEAKRKTVVYLDNSMSMQAKDKNGSELLQNVKRLLIDELGANAKDFLLITNQKTYDHLDAEPFKQEVLQLPYHPIKKDLSQVILESGSQAKKDRYAGADVYLFSDFRNSENPADSLPSNPSDRYFLVPVRSDRFENLVLDSLWISEFDRNDLKLRARIFAQGLDQDNLSVSLIVNGELFGKTSLKVENGRNSEVEFSIPPQMTGTGAMTFTDPRLGFDNTLFFQIPKRESTRVLVIGNKDEYLLRIFQDESFTLSFSSLEDLDQGSINDFDLVLINELKRLPTPLVQSLKAYAREEGNLVIIPSSEPDLYSYQAMMTSFGIGRILGQFNEQKLITSVNYGHPFFKNVFKGQVTNFDYPQASAGFEARFAVSSPLLSFEDGSAFISEIPFGDNTLYWISSPLGEETSNFTESPLIVPVFYNFSLAENKTGGLYSIIGRRNELIIKNDSLSGKTLKLVYGKDEFIPEQKSSSKQVTLLTHDYPVSPGIYQVYDEQKLLAEEAFNYDRNLIRTDYQDLDKLVMGLKNSRQLASPQSGLKEINDLFSSRTLWQLFTIFALIFLVLEMLIQKFFKN